MNDKDILYEQIRDIMYKVENNLTFTLHTSGTTGVPKEFKKDVALEMQKKKGGSEKDKWILTYSPLRWAGISVVLHAYKYAAQLIVPDSLRVEDIIKAAFENQVSHIALTPSMFRLMVLLDSDKIKKTNIRQCTFGGEAATQSVLDLAKNIWPNARVTHVYASTELGDICAVSDGMEGIPASKFKDYVITEEGELVIKEFQTNDIWELRNNRYYFKGRKQEVINVGGYKVFPISVEESALKAGAIQAKAYAVASTMLGSLVALDYVGEIEATYLMTELRKSLPKYAWPAQIKKVDTIILSAAGKIKRVKEN